MIKNPFPGPLPYRVADRAHLFGRNDLSRTLQDNILAYRCVTVYGPADAGKSSLMRASVIPSLVETHEVHVVAVEGWPAREDPLHWLVSVIYSDLGFGDPPGDVSDEEAVLAAARRLSRRSERLLLVHLDQTEQLLDSGRSEERIDAFFECVNDFVESPLPNVRVVISLREDHLGRFLARLRDPRSILEHGFRVGPLTAANLTAAACRAAAAGEPPQTWSPEELQQLMLKVRIPGQAPTGEAEVRLSNAQTVCRALFQQRAQEAGAGEGARSQSTGLDPVLRGLLEGPFTTVLGALDEDRALLFQRLTKLIRERGHEPEEGMSLYALFQQYLLRFGQEVFHDLFQETVTAPPAAPLPPVVGVMGRMARPGVHLTLLWEPLLSRAIAEGQPGRTVYTIQPSLVSYGGAPRVLKRAAGKTAWEREPELPGRFDFDNDIVVLRLYAGALTEPRAFPTQPDLLGTTSTIDDAVPLFLGIDGIEHAAWMQELLSRFRTVPGMFVGLSLLEFRDRMLLRWLYDQRPAPSGSVAILTPVAGRMEAELWDRGGGLPGTGRIAPVTEDPARLAALLDDYALETST